jgi:chromosome segregation ATPase
VLRATIDSLKTQLEKMEETQAANNSDVDNVRKEFSDRISAKEKKLQAVSRDRDQLKRRLQDLEKEQQNRYATVRVL